MTTRDRNALFRAIRLFVDGAEAAADAAASALGHPAKVRWADAGRARGRAAYAVVLCDGRGCAAAVAVDLDLDTAAAVSWSIHDELGCEVPPPPELELE